MRHALLFLATLASMALAQNWTYAVCAISILLAHEMGHYLACVRYGIAASLPYFIPMPIPGMFGTMGAFIELQSPLPNRRALFDMAIAGPLAGFAVALPMSILGLAMSHAAPAGRATDLVLGSPLLFRLIEWMLFGFSRVHTTSSLHPMALAGWLGCLATAINLLPTGQLDGGHILYAALGRKSRQLSWIIFACFAALVLWTLTYVLFLAFLFFLNRNEHPPTLNDSLDIGRNRKILAGVCAILFILCFMVFPFR